MNSLILKLLGVLSIGGSFTAINSVLNFLASSSGVAAYVVGVIALLVFVYGIWCGIEIIKSLSARSLTANKIFWAMQIPLLLSPGASYFLYTGFNFTVHYSFTQASPGFNVSAGGKLILSLFQFSSPLQVGINIFALVIFCYLSLVARKLKFVHSLENA